MLKKYPGATFVRVETDSDGVYEAHITKADGSAVTVEVNKSFAVTGEERRGGFGRGDHDGDGPGAPSRSGGLDGVPGSEVRSVAPGARGSAHPAP